MATSKKKYPSRVRFFIADDVRAEGQKPLILGLFADDTVLLEFSETEPEPTKDKPVAIQSLAILASFIGCNGSFKAETSLYGPSGLTLVEKQKMGDVVSADESIGKTSMNMMLKFIPFKVPALGEYKLVIKLDKKEYVYTFNILRKLLTKRV